MTLLLNIGFKRFKGRPGTVFGVFKVVGCSTSITIHVRVLAQQTRLDHEKIQETGTTPKLIYQ